MISPFSFFKWLRHMELNDKLIICYAIVVTLAFLLSLSLNGVHLV